MNPDQPSYQPQSSASQPPLQPERAKPSGDDPYAQAVYGDVGAPKPSRRKKMLLWSGIIILMALIGGGAVFGYFVPNQPSNVWKTGLNRTGDALEKTTISMTDKSKMEAFAKSQITASAEIKGADYSYSGTFNSKFDERKSDGNLEVIAKTAGQPDANFSAKFLSELKEGSTYPNIYFQLNGFKALGVDTLEFFLPGISAYEGKWIAIEETYLSALADQARQLGGLALPEPTTPAEEQKTELPTADEITELMKTISGLTSEYLLTADPAKAIFEQRKFIGKETVEGMKTYRYEVGINKAHAKDFCKAAIERLWNSAAFKKMLNSEGIDAATAKAQQDNTIKGCQDSMENEGKEFGTFDMWIDAKYKLVHKIRIYSEADRNIYTDFGQIYKGGDDLSLFLAMHDGPAESDGRLTVDTNLKSGETKANLTLKSVKKDNLYDATVTFGAKPYKEEIKIEKPAGAVPIKDIFDTYGIDPVGLVGLGLLGMGSSLQAAPQESDTSGTPTPLMYTN